MAASLMSNGGTSDPAIREPTLREVERVLHLFRDLTLNADARLITAVRSNPIERFVAAAAWWPEGTVGRFQLACQPGVARAELASLLLDRLAECARRAGMARLQWASLLAEDDKWLEVLRSQGFVSLHSERAFEVPYRHAWMRLTELHQKHQPQIPTNWQTEAIRDHSPETALDLIAPHRLMTPAEIRNRWRADSQFGFDLDLSCVLFDGARPFGAFLVRRIGEGCYIDVQVVQEQNPRLRSLAALLLLYHGVQRTPVDGPIRWLWFRSGQTEHRQTANLAHRLGGREVGRCHLMGKEL
jgi:hypothetical protein